jgi:hypothetical protein
MWKTQLVGIAIWSMIVAALFGLTEHEIRQEQRNRALIAAVAHGDTAKVDSLLAEGADANTHEEPARSETFPHWLWLWQIAGRRRDADAHAVPARSALLVAVEGSYYPTFPVCTMPENPELADALLRAGADVNARDEAGNPALLYAARNGDRPLVALLLSYDANVNLRLADGSTLLMALVGSGCTDPYILSEIVERSNVDARDGAGRTALTVAIANGNVVAVRPLLRHHASLTVADRRGEGPLALAYRLFRDEPTPVHRQIMRLLRSVTLDPRRVSGYTGRETRKI